MGPTLSPASLSRSGITSWVAAGTLPFVLCLLGSVLLVPAVSVAAGLQHRVAGFEVDSSTPEALRISIADLTPQWRPVALRNGSVTRHELSFNGMIASGEPGQPMVPRRGSWLVVPPGTRPELRVVSEDWNDAGNRPLIVSPVPVIVEGVEPGEQTLSEILVLPGEDLPVEARISDDVRRLVARRGTGNSGAAVTLGEVTWWRGHRVVPVNLIPVRYDGAGVAGSVLEAGAWEVRFVPDQAAGRDIPSVQTRRSASKNDSRFSSAFINSNLLEALPTEAVYHGRISRPGIDAARVRGGKSGSLLGPEARIAVQHTGLFRVTASRLRSQGMLPEGDIAEDQIRLYQRRYLSRLDDGSDDAPYAELEVPILMMGEGDLFDGDDFFYFYGLRLRDDTEFEADLGDGPESMYGAGDPYEMRNGQNWYWLAASEPDLGSSWARMAESTLPVASGQPLPSYRRDEHHEVQVAFRENVPATDGDRVYSNHHYDAEVSVAIAPLWAPDPAGMPVAIETSLASYRNVDRDLSLQLVTDNELTTPLEEFYFGNMVDSSRTYTVDASSIDGENAKIVMFRTEGASRLYTFMNWVKISYDALYRATSNGPHNEIDFHAGDDSGARPLAVTGFTSSDIGLIEITDPRQPEVVRLSAANILADGETWTVSIQPSQSGQKRRFYAAANWSTDGIPEYRYYESVPVPEQSNPTQLAGSEPDLVVIVHEEFAEAAERWVEHRRLRSGGDLEIHVVKLQDVFNWYSGGLRDPWAIKRFATHAINHWGSWALTLVGDANENVRELKVLAAARDWSRDWVPTHYHVQHAVSGQPELLASDKWYATLEEGLDYPDDEFPDNVRLPWEMYVGRLACNSVAELNLMIDKIMTVENVQPAQTWRRRGIWISDDAWSNGYGTEALSLLVHSTTEEQFGNSARNLLAPWWRSGSPVTMEADTLFLANWLDPHWPQGVNFDRPIGEFREFAEAEATPPLLAAMNRGGLVAQFQGHGNPHVLASEYWFQDREGGFYRQDVSGLSNATSPWFFFGLGCHIADWAQNTARSETTYHERCVSEKFILKNGGGAYGAYASSGFEYITPNRSFGEYIFRRWTLEPPVQRGPGETVDIRSRWMLGELLWAAEADMMADLGHATLYREMVAQYTMLGDPLMILDGGEPEVTAVLLGDPDQEIVDEVDLVASDPLNLKVVEIVARDEAGIDRIRVVDSDGFDVTEQLVTESLPEGAVSHQTVNYALEIPVHPYDHHLIVEIYDTGGSLASDRHYELILNMPQAAEFTVDGDAVDPATFVFLPDEWVPFSAQVASAAWLHDGMTLDLTSESLELQNVVFEMDKSNNLGLTFDALAVSDTEGERSVVLVIDEFETTWVLQNEDQEVLAAEIKQVFNFPNPMQEQTRFLFETSAGSGQGVVRIFSLAGRPVVRLPFDFAGNGAGVVEWEGRDDAGDQLGNGTYLYRVELDTAAGRTVSPMQRLVVMR